jgi:hypothetical protein
MVPMAPTVIPGLVPAVVLAMVPAVPPLAPVVVPAAAPVITPAVAPPITSAAVRVELLKLYPLKDAKAFLDSLEQIHFYLRMPDFSTGHADDSLTTDANNQEASREWEGQLHLTVKDGTLRFLFENKGSLYHGRSFEMLAILMQHCRPDMVSNAFTSLLSLLNDVQGESESIIKYCSCFGGLTLELARCKVVIPSFLLVMLFLCTLHSQYLVIFEQFWSRFKPIESATLDSIIADVTYHDGFTVVDHTKKKPASGPEPCVPAAALANTNSDCQGKVWQTPFKWLAQYGIKGIKGRWTCAMAGTGICPICHPNKLPRHVPTQCPMLAELNLKLITCLPIGGAPSLAPGPSPSPAPGPTPNGRAAAADASSVSGSLGSSSAPSSVTARVAPAGPPTGNFDFEKEFHWEGNEFGAEYIPPSKINMRVAPYLPSCSRIHAVPSILTSAISSPPQSKPPCLLSALQHLLNKLSLSPINVPLLHGRLAVADTGATNHMVPDKACFISYKLVSGLSVWMGKTHMFQSWVAALPSLPSMASVSWLETSSTFWAWWYLFTVYALMSPSVVVVSWALMNQGFLSTSLPFFCRLTWPWTAISPSTRSVILLHCTLSDTFNIGVLQSHTHLKFLCVCLRLLLPQFLRH